MSVSSNIYSSYAHTSSMNTMTNNSFRSGEYDIKLEAYMSSSMGLRNETNHDNYYINGLCEKSFKFSDIEKPYDAAITRCGVFAVGSGVTSDRASKLLMRLLDEKKDFLTASKSIYQLKKRLAEVVAHCNHGLIDEGEMEGDAFEASFAIAVYLKEYFVYAVCGEASIVHIKNKRVNRLRPQCGNLGIAPNVRPFIGKCEFHAEDKLIFLSKGAFAESSPEEICYQVIGESYPQSIAHGIIERVRYANPQDCTCMAVSAEPAKGIHTKTIIIAGICLLWTLLNILILILRG